MIAAFLNAQYVGFHSINCILPLVIVETFHLQMFIYHVFLLLQRYTYYMATEGILR